MMESRSGLLIVGVKGKRKLHKGRQRAEAVPDLMSLFWNMTVIVLALHTQRAILCHGNLKTTLKEKNQMAGNNQMARQIMIMLLA